MQWQSFLCDSWLQAGITSASGRESRERTEIQHNPPQLSSRPQTEILEVFDGKEAPSRPEEEVVKTFGLGRESSVS